jgi:hypothetical protein
MGKKKQENKYYTLDNILSKQCTYNMIFGERSNGKTYSVLKYALENALKGKGQFAIVRRWKEDITGRRASDIFSALNANNETSILSDRDYDGVTYWSGKFYRCVYDDNGKAVYNADVDCIGYCFALSETEHNKSISYPNITTILFDEFLTKGLYLNDEFVLFMNTISTIVRQRTDVTIFMLGNTVNKYCPYFKEMGLTHVKDMKQGDIDVYTYGDSDLKVAVEYCQTTVTKKANNFYFAFNNPKLHMITSGAWELDIYPHCPTKYQHKDIALIYFIIFDGEIFQCEIVDIKGEFFTYIHRKTTELKNTENDIIYSLEFNYRLNYNRNICKPTTDLQKKILWFFQTDRVFYQDNEVGNTIENYLKTCISMKGR